MVRCKQKLVLCVAEAQDMGCLCWQILVQTCRTRPPQQKLQLRIMLLSRQWMEPRRTRWRRAWPVWFVRTFCTTASGLSALLCGLRWVLRDAAACWRRSGCASPSACSLACTSSAPPATRAGWSVRLSVPPAAAPWRGFVRTTSWTTWWKPTSFSTQVGSRIQLFKPLNAQEGSEFCN